MLIPGHPDHRPPTLARKGSRLPVRPRSPGHSSLRDEARADVFDYIELFYNNRRRHGYNDEPSPVQVE